MVSSGLLIAGCVVPPACVVVLAAGGYCFYRRVLKIRDASAPTSLPMSATPPDAKAAVVAWVAEGVETPTLPFRNIVSPYTDQLTTPDLHAQTAAWPRLTARPRVSPQTILSKKGTRVLARRRTSSTTRQALEQARRDRSWFGIHGNETFESMEVPNGEDTQDPFQLDDAAVAAPPNLAGRGALRRRSATWAAQDFDTLSATTYLDAANLWHYVNDRSARPGPRPWLPAGYSEPNEQGASSTEGGSGESAGLGSSQECTERLMNQQRGSVVVPSLSFRTEVFAALGLDRRSSSQDAQAVSSNWRPDSEEYFAGMTIYSGSFPSITPLTAFPTRPPPSETLYQQHGNFTEYSADRQYPSRIRRQDSAPWFATPSVEALQGSATEANGFDDDNYADDADTQTEIAAAQEQEQRSAERMFEHARRPISWLPRQTSSGTLPEGTMAVGNLSISNPDQRSHRGEGTSSSGGEQEVLATPHYGAPQAWRQQ
ncbi:hypothetical protein JCM10908_007166 [Rhodotorula pacifica]|uniref:uncharacterized protein n=1 Tax=Rhodotorula pacifica TaxID=1495444 RepID=UPI00317A3559